MLSEDIANRLNLYDFFGFPNPQQRAEARNIFDMEKLSLVVLN